MEPLKLQKQVGVACIAITRFLGLIRLQHHTQQIKQADSTLTLVFNTHAITHALREMPHLRDTQMAFKGWM
jgi:hypothetical protein